MSETNNKYGIRYRVEQTGYTNTYAGLLLLREIVHNADAVERNIYAVVSGYDRSSAWRDDATRKMFGIALGCIEQWDTTSLANWCASFMEQNKAMWFTPAPAQEANHA